MHIPHNRLATGTEGPDGLPRTGKAADFGSVLVTPPAHRPAIRPEERSGRWDCPAWTGIDPAGETVLYIDARPFTRECIGAFLRSGLGGMEVLPLPVWPQQDSGCPDPRRVRAVIMNTDAEPMGRAPLAERIADIALRLPEIPRIILSALDDPGNVARAFAMGVKGYIPTSLPPPVVLEIVRFVCAGGSFAPASALLLLRRQATQDRFSPEPERSSPEGDDIEGTVRFSRRQMEILACLHQGLPNKLIAHQLSMSENTVKVHIRTIMKKLHATNRTQVVCLTLGIS